MSSNLLIGRSMAPALMWALLLIASLTLTACGPLGGSPPVDWAPPTVPLLVFNDATSFEAETPRTGKLLSAEGLITLRVDPSPGSSELAEALVVKQSAQLAPSRFLVFLAYSGSSSDGKARFSAYAGDGRAYTKEEASTEVMVGDGMENTYFGLLELGDDGSVNISTFGGLPMTSAATYQARYGVRFGGGDKTDSVSTSLDGLYSTETLRKLFSDSEFLAEVETSSFMKATPLGADTATVVAANAAAWRGDYQTALVLGRRLAEGGNGAAAYSVSQILRLGLAGHVDCEGAVYFAGRAVQLGFSFDQVAMVDVLVPAGVPPLLIGTPDDRCAPASGQTVASAPRRALVIGIDGYTDPALKVPGNRTSEDAVRVASILRDVAHYETVVTVPHDADRRAFIDALAEFVETIQQGDTVLVFYSGHGVELKGDNYLLLKDATQRLPVNDLQREEELRLVSISQRGLIDRLRERQPKNIVMVINACRNEIGPSATLSVGDGSIELSAPGKLEDAQPSTMIIYATSSGRPARICLDQDCSTDTSPMTVFTRRFVEALVVPNLAAKDLADLVGERVEADVDASIGEIQSVSVDDQTLHRTRDQLFLGPVVN